MLTRNAPVVQCSSSRRGNREEDELCGQGKGHYEACHQKEALAETGFDSRQAEAGHALLPGGTGKDLAEDVGRLLHSSPALLALTLRRLDLYSTPVQENWYA